jgi:hypothetical protein
MIRPLLRIYGLLWFLTALAAAITELVAGAATLTRGALHLPEAPAAHRGLTTVVVLAIHNGVVAGYPAALTRLGLNRRGVTRLAFGAVVAAGIAANAVLVGAALGAYGGRLLPFLAQLPVEWLALAAGAAAWFRAARSEPHLRGIAVLVAASVAAAALLEVYATP